MKKFGLIGGISWRSTMNYYERINETINQLSHDNTNPFLHLISLNQREIHDLQRAGDWKRIAEIFADAALKLSRSGAEGIAFCANTPHKIYHEIQALLDIPILHIGDAIATEANQHNWTRLGLIGTRFTMSEPFLRDRLAEQGFEILVPTETVQAEMQTRIYGELSTGNFDSTQQEYAREVIHSLVDAHVDAVILGCTEFPLLLRDCSCEVPLIDTIQVHCDQIVRFITEAPLEEAI